MGDIPVTFGEWLGDAIGERYGSLRRFARHIGVHHATVSRWVNDERVSLDAESYAKIAAALGVSVQYVMWRHGVIDDLPEDPTAYILQRDVQQLTAAAEQLARREEVQPEAQYEEVPRSIIIIDNGTWRRIDQGGSMKVLASLLADRQRPWFAVTAPNDLRSRDLIAARGQMIVCESITDLAQLQDGDAVLAIVNGDECLISWHRDAAVTLPNVVGRAFLAQSGG